MKTTQDLEQCCAEHLQTLQLEKALTQDGNGEMPSRSHCTTHASMEWMLIEEEETL